MATELEYSDILRYKTNSSAKYRPGLTDNEKRNIRDKAARYIVEKDQLHVELMDKNLDLVRKRRVIVNEEEKKRILRICHEGIDGVHFGRDKTYGKVNPLYNIILYNIILYYINLIFILFPVIDS